MCTSKRRPQPRIRLPHPDALPLSPPACVLSSARYGPRQHDFLSFLRSALSAPRRIAARSVRPSSDPRFHSKLRWGSCSARRRPSAAQLPSFPALPQPASLRTAARLLPLPLYIPLHPIRAVPSRRSPAPCNRFVLRAAPPPAVCIRPAAARRSSDHTPAQRPHSGRSCRADSPAALSAGPRRRARLTGRPPRSYGDIPRRPPMHRHTHFLTNITKCVNRMLWQYFALIDPKKKKPRARPAGFPGPFARSRLTEPAGRLFPVPISSYIYHS